MPRTTTYYCYNCNSHVTRYACESSCSESNVWKIDGNTKTKRLGSVSTPVLTDHRTEAV